MPDLLGTDILYRRWDARPDAVSARAVFLLVHGLGAHGDRWRFVAEELATNGFTSYAIELRGFGRSPERPRGHVDSLRIWERDILDLRETIVRENPGKPVLLLGESVGGLVAFNLACRYPDAFAAAVLMSPDFKNGLKFPLSAYLKIAAFVLVKPRATLDIPFTSAMCTRDDVYRAEMDANPDELRIASVRCLMSILAEQSKSARLARKLRTPSLFLLAGTDHLVDERAGRKVFAKILLADKKLIDYPEMLHALSIDLGRDRVCRDIIDWVGGRI
jgi:alpha-beta hydrolase superfamily lysophospholipase